MTPRNVIKYEIIPNVTPTSSVQQVAKEELSIGIYIPRAIIIISLSVTTQTLRHYVITLVVTHNSLGTD